MAKQFGESEMNDTEPEINLNEAQHFLDLLGAGENFTFQTFDESAQKKASLSQVFHGRFIEYAKALSMLNMRGAGVFVMVNEGDGEIKAGKNTCRTNENVIRVRALFVDLDGSPLIPVLEAEARPNIVVESSPGRAHAYWKTTDTALEEFSRCQSALADRFNGDPSVKDLARVMRLPGFFHQKREPYMTKIVAITLAE